MKHFSNLIKFIFALIAIGVGVIIAVASYDYYSTVTVDWSKTKDVFDVLKNAATIIALGVGSVWAYFNFFKGRTYRSRLEPKVSGKIISRNGAYYLIVTAQLKNIGLSDVKIDQKGSALRVFAYTFAERPSKARSVEQFRLITLSVFEDHGWIEPGELIEDQRLIAIPDVEHVALQIRLRLVSNGIEWNSAAIIEPPPIESSADSLRIEAKAPGFLEGKDSKLLKDKKLINNGSTSTDDIANITTQKKEDTEESRRIEDEKTPEDIINVEQQTQTEMTKESKATSEASHEAH